MFNTPTVLSLPCSIKSLALAEPNGAQRSPQPLSTQEKSIQARMPAGWRFGLSNGELAVILPIVIVSVSSIVASLAIIVRLLSNILDNCLNFWAYSPPANQVVIEAGDMRLEFGCSMEPVPWDFIAEFSRSRRDATNRGFAPGYTKEWWFNNQDQKRLCYARIRVVPDGGKAVRPGKPAR